MERIKKIIEFFVLVMIFILLMKVCTKHELRNGIEEIQNLSINGTIKDKNIDRNEHNYRVLIVIDDNNNSRKINIHLDNDELYNFIQINDSIVKIKGELKVKIYRGNHDTLFTIN